MTRGPKVNITFRETQKKPVVHYNDIIDPEYWNKKVVPAVASVLNKLDQSQSA